MEEKADQVTREIIENWRPELHHPDFSVPVLQAVAHARFRQMQRQTFWAWLFVVLTAELAIGLWLWTSGVTLAEVAAFPYRVVNGFGLAWRELLEYHYLLVPLAGVLLIKRIIEAKFGY